MKNYERKTRKSNKGFVMFITTAILVVMISFFLIFGSGINSSAISYNIDAISATKEKIEENIQCIAEKINGVLCKEGTFQEISIKKGEIYANAHAEAVKQINAYYDQMIVNADDYLDWYYSFSGQWTQILNLIKGVAKFSVEEEVTKFIQMKMEEHITPDSDIVSAIDNIYLAAKDKAELVERSIIEANRITVKDDGTIYIIVDTTLDDVLSEHVEKSDRNHVITATTSIAAGITSSMLAKKAVSKIITKSVSQLAIKTSTKAVVSLIGKFAGPVVGVVTFLVVDVLGMNLDEAVNRDAYKADIVKGINEERVSFIKSIDAYFSSLEQNGV